MMNVTRCLLQGVPLPNYLCGELACAAVYTVTCMSKTIAGLQTNIGTQADLGIQADVSHLRIIGVRAFINEHAQQPKIMQGLSEARVVMYTPNRKA